MIFYIYLLINLIKSNSLWIDTSITCACVEILYLATAYQNIT